MRAIAYVLITEFDTLPWLVFWREAPEGGDAHDWFAGGHTVAELHDLLEHESMMYAVAEPAPVGAAPSLATRGGSAATLPPTSPPDPLATSAGPSLSKTTGRLRPLSHALRRPSGTPPGIPADLTADRNSADLNNPFRDLKPQDLDLDAAVDDSLKQAAAQISAGIQQVDDEKEKEAAGTIADQLVAIVRDPEMRCDLFHDRLERTYIRLPVARPMQHREVWRIHSRQFENWLRWRYFQKTEKSVRADAITTALATLDGLALFEGPERTVSLRIAGYEGAIYLDLGNAGWEIVKIDAYGWVVLRDEEIPDAVCFWRPRTMEALPMPVPGGQVEELRRFVNVVDGDWPLLVGFLLACFRPEGPYPVLELSGEQGAAKTTTAKVVRRLIDPSQALVRSSPREERDLAIGAQRAWLPVFDNLSGIPQWLSDGLCGLSTGRAFAIRANYSDDDEVVFDAMRPVIVAGIESVISSGDLLDRAVVLVLPRLADHEEESAFWRAFEASRPRILGALLGVVSGALAMLPKVQIETLPRMADFALWVTAAEPRLGWKAGTFIGAYLRRRGETDLFALEASALGGHLRTWLASRAGGHRTTWEGTATDLLDRLNAYVGESVARSRVWPKQPNKLSGALRRLAPNLRAVGIEVDLGERSPDKQRARLISITYDPTHVPPPPPEVSGTRPSAPSASSNASQPGSSMSGVEREKSVSSGHVGADDRPDDHPNADDRVPDDEGHRADEQADAIVRRPGRGAAWTAEGSDDPDGQVLGSGADITPVTEVSHSAGEETEEWML